MKRREFLGTVAAGMAARMQGPTVPKTQKPVYDRAKADEWAQKAQAGDPWAALSGIEELMKNKPSLGDALEAWSQNPKV